MQFRLYFDDSSRILSQSSSFKPWSILLRFPTYPIATAVQYCVSLIYWLITCALLCGCTQCTVTNFHPMYYWIFYLCTYMYCIIIVALSYPHIIPIANQYNKQLSYLPMFLLALLYNVQNSTAYPPIIPFACQYNVQYCTVQLNLSTYHPNS
jgi:hypothetical protein